MTSTRTVLPSDQFVAGVPEMSGQLDPQFTEPYPYPFVYPRSRSAVFFDRLAQRVPAWAGPAAVTGLIGAAIGFTLWVHPTTSPPTCLMRILTGLDCPGCGGTRAAWYLLHGDIPAAFQHHAMFVIAVPFLLYLHVSWTLRRTLGWRVPKLKISGNAALVFMLAWLVFSIARNLPWAPFTWFYV